MTTYTDKGAKISCTIVDNMIGGSPGSKTLIASEPRGITY